MSRCKSLIAVVAVALALACAGTVSGARLLSSEQAVVKAESREALAGLGSTVKVTVSLFGKPDDAQEAVVIAFLEQKLKDAGVTFTAIKLISKNIPATSGRRLNGLLDDLEPFLFQLNFEVQGLLTIIQANLAVITLTLIPIEGALLSIVGAVVNAVVAILVAL